VKLVFRYPDTGEIHEHQAGDVSIEAIFRREARFFDANFAGWSDIPDLTVTFQLVSVEGTDQ
jgi:hypothetical protein